MSDFKKGDKVSWNSSQGKVEGEVVRKVTSDTHIEGHQVRASKDEPQYEVKSDETARTRFISRMR